MEDLLIGKTFVTLTSAKGEIERLLLEESEGGVCITRAEEYVNATLDHRKPRRVWFKSSAVIRRRIYAGPGTSAA